MRERAESLLKEMTQNPSAQFHRDQYEAIFELVVNRKKLLVVQKTGWGKSAVYFIATQMLREQGEGPSVIISPLIALMRNQITRASRSGLQVATINSSQRDQEREETIRLILSGKVDAIIISPEQLANDSFVSEVLVHVFSKAGLFVIDEAHCISDWGHDFRPDYRRIARVIQKMPKGLPILATTATANNRVIADIQEQIGNEMILLRGPLMRTSLQMQNIVKKTRAFRLAWLAKIIPSLDHTGIVYAKTVRDCDLVADWLSANGIQASSYHGEVDDDVRLALEDDLTHNRLKVLVATSALGMGYDKPDIGFIIHFQAPGNVIEYYQQVGRAGRGIENARCVLMLGDEDEKIQSFFIQSAFPTEDEVAQILEVIEDEDGLKKYEIERFTNLDSDSIAKVLKFLSVENPSPLYKDGSTYYRTSLDYELPHERIARLSSIKAGEWEELLRYHASTECLMKFLANALDDDCVEKCGKCANCLPTNALEVSAPKSLIQAATTFMRHRYVKIKPRKMFGASGKLVRSAFPVYQFPYKNSALCAEEGMALSSWRDGGWGDLVAEGKENHDFSDELISPMVEMISAMTLSDTPLWLTYVPSLRHPDVLKNFANKLANALGIPCHDAVAMVSLRPPQKTMENNFRRSENLDGAFAIAESRVPSSPVLLLDDAVDSGWTFTVVAALLRRHGSGAVYPVALTSTRN